MTQNTTATAHTLLLAEVRKLRSQVAELEQAAGIAGTPSWATPTVRFTIACRHCGVLHTTDEDYGPDHYPAAALTNPGNYFDHEWVVADDDTPCCLNCWEPVRCEECGEPIHAWQQAALTDRRQYTSHHDCLTDEELGKAEVMPALEAANALHEAWAERTHAENVAQENTGGESPVTVDLKPARPVVPPLEFPPPDCSICGHEVETYGDLFTCGSCQVTWPIHNAHLTDGEWDDPDAAQCDSVHTYTGHRYPCVLHAGHLGQHHNLALYEGWPLNPEVAR